MVATHLTASQSFVGVDLHKTSVTLAAVDPGGAVIDRLTCPTKCIDRIERFIAELPGPVHLAVEACPFVEWFIDRFRHSVARFDLADATELWRMRGKRRKTDRNDALEIARRLARGECPLGWIADESVMQLRKLGRHWRRLSRVLSRAKHGMRSMLNAAHLTGPALDAANAHKWLLAHGHALKPAQWQAFSDLVEMLQLLERQRARLRTQIIAANRDERFSAQMAILKSVPGIDEVWAAIIAAEVGEFTRFPNAETLVFWAGLTADNKQSAGQTRSGHITKAGSATLRWALGKAALCLCRSDARWEAQRQRLIARRGKPIANVAMARKLLETLYAMIRDGTEYERAEPTHHTAKANQARLNKRTARKPRKKEPAQR